MVHIGTNNHGNTAEQVAEGIETIVTLISEKQPQAYIVVLVSIIAEDALRTDFYSLFLHFSFIYPQKLLPRGQNPNPLREKNQEINERLERLLSPVPKTQLVSIDPGFVLPDGCISHHDMYDYLHLTRQGYQRAFDSVYDLLLQLLSE